MDICRIAVTACLVAFTLPCHADWHQFRNDSARSGYTSEVLPQSLVLCWSHQSQHRPVPAWPTRNRLRFDRAFQPIVADGILCFGSSADDTVYALDSSTGEIVWEFTTDAPIRFAPVAWKDRLFVVSDDGHLYCLSLGTGELIWKYRGGPRDEMLLGNDRMISRWPARGGPVVVENVVYFGAGIWPSEGIYLYALDARTGEVLWQNDSSGSIEMDQPHATARAKSGISAQGYFAATEDMLLVPTGRAVPAVLRRSDGTLSHFPLQAHQHSGGADVVAIDPYFVNSGCVYAIADGEKVGTVGLEVAVTPDYLIHAIEDTISGLDRRQLTVRREITDRKGKKQWITRLTSPVWKIPVPFNAKPVIPLPEDRRAPANRMDSTGWASPVLEKEAASLIVAGDKVIVGGKDRVSIVSISRREIVWRSDVDGTAHGLAVADGRLYVSTDQGVIHCFGTEEMSGGSKQMADHSTSPATDPQIVDAVDQILRQTAITEGYCVDLGCGTGGLTLELARRTKLRIYAVDEDPANVRLLRKTLDRAGLYGPQVTVHCCEPSDVPYADYCADLVVSGRSVSKEPREALLAEGHRLCRPCGGMLAVGRAGQMQVSSRGPLEGGGSWTHQNSSPANTLCSDERLVRGPLEMLWFRDTDFLLANRHGRSPTSLVQDGLVFVPGLNGLRAQSLYNGRVLWEFDAPGILASYNREHSIGAAWTGGNICLGPDRVFLHNGKVCFVLDARSGRKLAEWKPPAHPDGKPSLWGYMAYHDGMLFGTLAREDYLIKCWSDRWDTGQQFTESTVLFALDATTGERLWTYEAENSIRHNAIAIGDDRVYLVDRPVSAEDELGFIEGPTSAEKRRGVSVDETDVSEPTHPPGRLLAIDRRTGKVAWVSEKPAFGTLLIYSTEHNLLWMGYQAAHQASRPSELGNRMAAFDAKDGRLVWDVAADYADRPVLNGQTIYAPPGAWDLRTGEKLPFTLERSYGCGIVSGCRNMLVFRSATLGYIDLNVSPETQNYGGIRPGCWIAAIPAGGVLLMPDAASWCTCSYLNQGTIVLKPASD